MVEFNISGASKFGTALCAACYDIEGYFLFTMSEYIKVFKIESVKNTQEVYVLDTYPIYELLSTPIREAIQPLE